MNCRCRVVVCFPIVMLAYVPTPPSWAQPAARPKAADAAQVAAEKSAKPAAGKRAAAPAAEKAPARADGEKAAARPAAKKPTVPAEQGQPAVQMPEDESGGDSGVAAILATKPNTPVDCTRAATILADLDRPDLAKRYLKKVLDAKLSPKQLADLGDEIGSAALISMGQRDALRPEGRQLADAVSNAVTARREDTSRIAALIQQLNDPSPERRNLAMVQLQEVPRAAIGPLIEVLANSTRADEHANVRTVLAGMGRTGREALVGVLEQADAKLAVQVILALPETKDAMVELALLAPCLSERSDAEVRQAATTVFKRLYGAVPYRQEAVRLLTRVATEAFDRRELRQGTSGESTELWQWDPDKRRCVVAPCNADDARLAMAARWAYDAYRLSADPPVEALYLATLLEAAQYRRGLDQPLAETDAAVIVAKRCGPKSIEGALARAMPSAATPGGHVGAAVAATTLLGQIGTARELLYPGTKPSLLVQAVRHPDCRVRMAALRAIMRLCPTRPYAGSSDVPRALASFAASGGVRRALVAARNLQQARDLAGMLAAHGLQADAAAHGREMLQLAAASPDYEIALIDVSIGQPPIEILLQQLRRDERTASLRVGLMARAGYMSQAEHAARSDPLSMAFAWPNDEQGLAWQLKQLAALRPREFADFNTRQRQAAEALRLLAELSRSGDKLYDLRPTQAAVLTALYAPKLSLKAVEVLANLNSAESQQALVEVASNPIMSDDLRRAAAKAFRQNTEKHGILLTSDEIRQQYRRYNESEKLDVGTQHVLRLILDCIEAPSGIKRSRR
jgi:hypothetical protein